jgi:hypothetical protein
MLRTWAASVKLADETNAGLRPITMHLACMLDLIEVSISKECGSLLEALACAHLSRPAVRNPVDLVWTGPQVPGIANPDTSVVARELFGSANEAK